MKGTDCTEQQLARAGEFLTNRGWPEGQDFRRVSRADVARIVAWYGAMRFIAGRDGDAGTLEAPNEIVTVHPHTEGSPDR